LQAGATYTYEKLNKDDLWGDLDASSDVGGDTPVRDELRSYWDSDTGQCDDPLVWWNSHRETYPNLARMAYDMLAIPPMSDDASVYLAVLST
jgi:hypothetical protein